MLKLLKYIPVIVEFIHYLIDMYYLRILKKDLKEMEEIKKRRGLILEDFKKIEAIENEEEKNEAYRDILKRLNNHRMQ